LLDTPMALAADAPPVAGTGAKGVLHVAARVVPTPRTISREAQEFLAAAAARQATSPAPEQPAVSDKAGWKARIAATNGSFGPMIDALLMNPATVERKTIGGANVCVGTPKDMRHPDRARLCIHGGAFTVLGGRYVEGDAAQAAAEGGCMAYSIDYRMPPDFPFPAAVDDCVAAYRELIKIYNPKKIAISGASAGGNLAGAMTLKIRDLGLPMPGVVGMMTPATDLLGRGDTRNTNVGVDVMLNDLHGDRALPLYANGHDMKDPYLSPVFGDFSKGFPPTYLQSGTRDLLLSDTVLMHRALVRAGVEAELHVWEAAPHGGFGGFSPEDAEIRQQFLKFMDKHMA
jgi:acetyl esterase/lipase